MKLNQVPIPAYLLFLTFDLSIAQISSTDIELVGQRVDGDGHLLNREGICGSKDIRNNAESLKQLSNCSVIVGYLMVVLMEWAKEEDFNAHVYPNLREVTDYIIFYRVEGLLSLGQLFPNLMMIRGQNLFMDYALVIYEMPQLQEIGLKFLTTIQRGFIRIEHNPQLCYVDTVDWYIITGKKGNHFKGNGNSICPGKDSCRGCDDKNCWSAKACQKKTMGPCNEECLGGCKGKGKAKEGNCYRCKNWLELDRCVPKCSKQTVEYKPAKRCITRNLCPQLYDGKGWVWDRKCINKCPVGYRVVIKNGNKLCRECSGGCPIVCLGSEITTIAEAQLYRGCKIINGSLQIRLKMNNTDDLMKELEDSLGSVEEITGYLKIYRAIPITSLAFLKNLTVIRGEELEYGQYSLIVYEMDNLQFLWNWTESKRLKLSNGTIFFHYNSKLCLREIERLKNVLGIEYTHYGVSSTSNGYKMMCHLTTLNTESAVLDSKSANITFQRYISNNSSRKIEGYYVYYIENPEDDIKDVYARDACFGNEWKTVFVEDPATEKPKNLTVTLTKLKAYTTYGFYVETYSRINETESQNGKSAIKFFKTEMDLPSVPHNVQTTSLSTDTITLYWEDDPQYTGIITRYIVELYIQLDETKVLDTRNYCEHPLVQTPPAKEIKINTQEAMDEFNNDRSCNCIQESEYFSKIIESKQTTEINTKGDHTLNCHQDQDKIPDIISILRCDTLIYQLDGGNQTLEREARDTEAHINPKVFDASATARPPLENVTRGNKFHYFSTNFTTPHKNYTLRDLKHYSRYLIYFAACKGDKDSDCGVIAMVVQRTMKNTTSDDVTSLTAKIVGKSSVDLFWKEPEDPNGIIVSYTLQYKLIGLVNFKSISICIPRLQHEKNGFKYSLKNLLPGNYSVIVKATSLAGDGNFTMPVIFDLSREHFKFDWIIFSSITVTVLGLILGVFYWTRVRRSTMRRSFSDTDLLIGSNVRFVSEENEGIVEFAERF